MPRSLRALHGLLLAASLLFGSQLSNAQTFEASVPSPSAVADKSTIVDSIAQKHMSEKPIPGLSLAVVKDGRLVNQSSYGVAELASMRLTTNTSIYQLASVTKIFTGIGLMILVEEGRIALDDPIHDYLPTLPEAWRGVTVRQAVSHTSGLPNLLDENGDPPGGTMSEAWQRVQEKSLKETPGKVWSYSQMGPEVIRRITEEVTDQSWEDFVRERILEPTGMQNTYFLYQSPPDSSRVTTGYDLEDGSLISHDWAKSYDYYIPTAMGIFSTTGDLARLINALRSGKLLNLSTRQAMWTPSSHEEGGLKDWGDGTVGYGVGWIVDTDQGHQRRWHSGGGHSAFVYYPNDDLTVIVLTNLSGAGPNAIASDIADVFL